MTCFTKWLNPALAVLLAGMVAGCQSLQDVSLTGELWRKDPTASPADTAHGKNYLYSQFARVTLTPFAVAGDATVLAAALGAGCALTTFADACQQGARNGGRVSY